MSLRGPLVLGLMVFATARPALAQKAEAGAAFERGHALMAKGEYAEACKELETSMRLDAQNGTLYNLALCHEQLGKIATAWTELKELADTDTNRARASDSARRASALAKKITRMRISVAVPPDGINIKRDGVDVTTLIGQDVPVDPGRYTFVATAPGRRPLTLQLDMTAPGQTVAVAIPELAQEAEQPPKNPSVMSSDVSPFSLAETLRPVALPRHVAELDGSLVWGSSSKFNQDSIDTVLRGRVGLGPVEGLAELAIHTRYEELMNRPTLVRYAMVGANYVINPLFTGGLAYTYKHPLGDDVDRGTILRGGLTNKHIFTPKIALVGYGGAAFETSTTRAIDGERTEFAFEGEGRMQLAPMHRLTFTAWTDLALNVGGVLRKETLDLDFGAGALVAIDAHTDAYMNLMFVVAPSTSDLRVYTFGVRRRLP